MRFDRALNRLALPLEITVISPLAIRAEGLDPCAPEGACAVTRIGGAAPTAFVPGSSLRGVLRAQARLRLARLGPVRGVPALADPTAPIAPKGPPRAAADLYRLAPLEARLFGAPGLRGRLTVYDLMPWPADAAPADRAPAPRVRRATADGRVFEAIAPGARLYTQIVLSNFPTWQLGLIAAGLAALNAGTARLGGGGAHGQGRVQVHTPGLIYTQPAPTNELPLALGELVDPASATAHGLLPMGVLPAKFGDVRGLVRRFDVPTEQVPEWLAAGTRALEALA